MPSRKLAARGGEPDCPTDMVPLGSSDLAPCAINETVGLGSCEQRTVALDAAIATLKHAIVELLTGHGKQSQLGDELGAVLATIAEERQSAERRDAELKALLEAAAEEADSKQRTLMDQQDAVLEALLNEHERQIQALEHEVEVQDESVATLQRELDRKATLIESLSEQPTAPQCRVDFPQMWPSSNELDEASPVGDSGDSARERVAMARLLADRDHLLASLRLLKRQRDDAQQETLDLVEQLAVANTELEALRAQLPSVTAPPVPAPSGPSAAAAPHASVSWRGEPARPAQAGPRPTDSSVFCGSDRADDAMARPIRASKAPTLPPTEAETDPNDDAGVDASGSRLPGAVTTRPRGSGDAFLPNEPLRAPLFPQLPSPSMAGPGGSPVEAGRKPAPLGPSPSPASGAQASLRHPDGNRLGARGLGSERKPPLKRKPDPTRSPLGTYSLTGSAEPESLRPAGRKSGRPSGKGRP